MCPICFCDIFLDKVTAKGVIPFSQALKLLLDSRGGGGAFQFCHWLLKAARGTSLTLPDRISVSLSGHNRNTYRMEL